MNDHGPDWTLLRSFAAVAEAGSLSGAAQKLALSQPTLGRHIKALEADLGAALFTRTARGLEPTTLALGLLDEVQVMQAAANRLSLAAEGQSAQLSGTVRITASVVVSHYILPPIVAAIRRAEPNIQIDLVPSDTSENLLFREADIALRMYRPEQLDIITRHVADQSFGLYGARSYLDRCGRPVTLSDLEGLDMIGYDRSELMIRSMRTMGFDVGRSFFAVRCDNQAAYWQLVRAGAGIGPMQCVVADADPLVERILPDLRFPALPIWLSAPQALRQNPRIRRVWDMLAEALAAQAA